MPQLRQLHQSTRPGSARQLGPAFRRHAVTVRGQLAGLGLMTIPALVHPIPVGADLHATLQILAVLAGFAGSLIVFGGLLLRAFPSPEDSSEAPDPTEDFRRGLPFDLTTRVDRVLLAVAAGLALGAIWCLVRVFSDGWTGHLPDALMLGLPAAALGWAGLSSLRSTGA